jgi:hypothetical protein
MTRPEIVSLIDNALEFHCEREDSENHKILWDILHMVFDLDDDHIGEAVDYAEPGYSSVVDPSGSPNFPVFLANWNSKSRWDSDLNKSVTTCELMPKLARLIEENNGAIQWSDEWDVCSDCRKAYRNSPDSHGWKQYGAVIDGDAICGECINEDPSEYFEWLRGESDRAVTIHGVDPAEHGYVKVNSQSFEHGLYGGQDASPISIAECLQNAEIEDFIFFVDSTGQFDLRFSVYVIEDEHAGAVEALSSGNTTCEVDPKVALEQGLKAASKAMAEARGEGVTVADVDIGTGTGTARVITPEQFVNGDY